MGKSIPMHIIINQTSYKKIKAAREKKTHVHRDKDKSDSRFLIRKNKTVEQHL